jgi:hypothetical protein
VLLYRKIHGKTFVSLSPNEHEVKMGIKQIIAMFEGTIGKAILSTVLLLNQLPATKLILMIIT